MLNELQTDLGEHPNWTGPVLEWQELALLHMDASMRTLAVRATGMVAYLATPMPVHGSDPVFVADLADGWRRSLIGVARVRCYSPLANAQIIAEFTGADASVCRPQISTELRLVDVVVVPPMAGWESSVDVWRVVCAALAANIPVYVLAEQAGGVSWA